MKNPKSNDRFPPTPIYTKLKDYLFALVVLAACSILAYASSGYLEITNVLMIYLVGILAVVIKGGQGPSTFASVLGVLSFDYFIVPPQFHFAPTDTQYVLTLGVILLFTLTISKQMEHNRRQTTILRLKEERTAALFDLSRKLAASQDVDRMLGIAAEHIADIFDCRVAILMPKADETLTVRAGWAPGFALDPLEQKTAKWTFQSGNIAGKDTSNFSTAGALYIALMAAGGPVGILAVQPRDSGQPMSSEQQHLLQALANQIGASFQNVHLSLESQKAHLKAETEQLRSALLSSVSHDLRTPLAVITGSASSLLDPEGHLTEGARQDLARDIYNESERLNRFLSNLLEMTRLSAGKVQLKMEIQPLEEVVGGSLSRLEKKLGGRNVKADLPEDLPMLPLDSLLMEQVFINLIENAAKYTPDGSPIGISAHVRKNMLKVEVADSGPGLPPGDEELVFEKFYRGKSTSHKTGVGLGLAICKAVVEAHGGRIWAENRPEGGAVFYFTLPLADDPVPSEK